MVDMKKYCVIEAREWYLKDNGKWTTDLQKAALFSDKGESGILLRSRAKKQ